MMSHSSKNEEDNLLGNTHTPESEISEIMIGYLDRVETFMDNLREKTPVNHQHFSDYLHETRREIKILKVGKLTPEILKKSEIYRDVSKLLNHDEHLLNEFVYFVVSKPLIKDRPMITAKRMLAPVATLQLEQVSKNHSENKQSDREAERKMEHAAMKPHLTKPYYKTFTKPAAKCQLEKNLLLRPSATVSSSRTNVTSAKLPLSFPSFGTNITSAKLPLSFPSFGSNAVRESSNFSTPINHSVDKTLKKLDAVSSLYLNRVDKTSLWKANTAPHFIPELVNPASSSDSSSNFSESAFLQTDKELTEKLSKMRVYEDRSLKKDLQKKQVAPRSIVLGPFYKGQQINPNQMSINTKEDCKNAINHNYPIINTPSLSQLSEGMPMDNKNPLEFNPSKRPFTIPKKTVEEKKMHLLMADRYLADVDDERNSSCIKTFLGLMNKMEKMSEKERESFTLDDKLGGKSSVLHRLFIKKIYRKDAEITIKGLKEKPYINIPNVLKKLMDAGKKRGETNKIYKNKRCTETEEQLYFKCLDWQREHFKAEDSKNLKRTELIDEIEKISKCGDVLACDLPTNRIILKDISQLITHLIEKQVKTKKADRIKLKSFLANFIPRLLNNTKTDEAVQAERINSAIFDHSDSRSTSFHNYNPDEDISLFFGNTTWFCFFRYYHLLYTRVATIYDECDKRRDEKGQPKLGTTVKYTNTFESSYSHYLSLVKEFMCKTINELEFEDRIRKEIGVHAYTSYTIDKLLKLIVKELLAIIKNPSFNELYCQQLSRFHLPSAELNYQQSAEELDSPIYKFLFNKKEKKITIAMIDPHKSETK